jgi:hypothetical protein
MLTKTFIQIGTPKDHKMLIKVPMFKTTRDQVPSSKTRFIDSSYI